MTTPFVSLLLYDKLSKQLIFFRGPLSKAIGRLFKLIVAIFTLTGWLVDQSANLVPVFYSILLGTHEQYFVLSQINNI